MSGQKRHPLPASEEARDEEIPEHVELEKGLGDDTAAPARPAERPVAPDGAPYGEAAHDGKRNCSPRHVSVTGADRALQETDGWRKVSPEK